MFDEISSLQLKKKIIQALWFDLKKNIEFEFSAKWCKDPTNGQTHKDFFNII